MSCFGAPNFDAKLVMPSIDMTFIKLLEVKSLKFPPYHHFHTEQCSSFLFTWQSRSTFPVFLYFNLFFFQAQSSCILEILGKNLSSFKLL